MKPRLTVDLAKSAQKIRENFSAFKRDKLITVAGRRWPRRGVSAYRL